MLFHLILPLIQTSLLLNKDQCFVSLMKSPEKAKISAGLNEIIFRKKIFSVTKSLATGLGTADFIKIYGI